MSEGWVGKRLERGATRAGFGVSRAWATSLSLMRLPLPPTYMCPTAAALWGSRGRLVEW